MPAAGEAVKELGARCRHVIELEKSESQRRQAKNRENRKVVPERLKHKLPHHSKLVEDFNEAIPAPYPESRLGDKVMVANGVGFLEAPGIVYYLVPLVSDSDRF